MKRKLENKKSREVLLTVDLEQTDVDPYLDASYKRIVSKIRIDGFRKGKAPRHIVEKTLGSNYLLEEALESIVNKEVLKAIEEESIEAYGLPSVDPGDVSLDPVRFKARIALKPVVTLAAYKDFSIEADPVEVTDEQVQQTLENLRNQIAPWEPVDRGVLFGDLVNLTVKAWNDEGTELINSAKVDYIPQSKAEEPYPGFAEALVGNPSGKLDQIKLKSKSACEGVTLLGNAPVFEVTINSVKAKKLAELNDEFAKGVGNGYESFAALQDEIKNNMLEEKMRQSKQSHQQKLVDHLISTASYEMSPLLIDQEVNRTLYQQAQFVKDQKISMEDYLKNIGMSEKQFSQRIREDSDYKIKRSLVLQELAIQEQLEVEDKELNTEIEMITSRNRSNTERKTMKKYFSSVSGRENLRQSLLEQKTIEHLSGKGWDQPESAEAPANDKPE